MSSFNFNRVELQYKIVYNLEHGSPEFVKFYEAMGHKVSLFYKCLGAHVIAQIQFALVKWEERFKSIIYVQIYTPPGCIHFASLFLIFIWNLCLESCKIRLTFKGGLDFEVAST